MTDASEVVEAVARAIADRRGSKVVQHMHRSDARAAIAACEASIRGEVEAEVAEFLNDQAGLEMPEANPLYQVGYGNALTEAARAIEYGDHRQQRDDVT